MSSSAWPCGREKTFVRGVVPRCEECGTVSHVIVLEATEDDVECDEEEDSHDEEFPTVPAHIVLPVGPRGGKRKC